jgi:hypothetical protein
MPWWGFRLALKRRALGAANRLEHWANRLVDEMKQQNVELHSPDDSDYSVPITLKHLRDAALHLACFAVLG